MSLSRKWLQLQCYGTTSSSITILPMHDCLVSVMNETYTNMAENMHVPVECSHVVSHRVLPLQTHNSVYVYYLCQGCHVMYLVSH